MGKDLLHRSAKRGFMEIQGLARIAGANRVVNGIAIGPTILRAPSVMPARQIIGRIATEKDPDRVARLVTQLGLSVHLRSTGGRPLRLRRQAELVHEGLLAAGNNPSIDGSRYTAMAERLDELEGTPLRRLLSKHF